MDEMKSFFVLLACLSITPCATEASQFVHHHCDQVIDKGYYTICYDYHMKGARFVAYELDGNLVNKVNIKKRPRFYPEKSIPKLYRTYPKDYTHNEFHADKGHLMPDANIDYSQDSLNSAYTMANIIPQHRSINRYGWKKLERYERLIASKLGRVNVLNGVDYGVRPQRLGKSGIAYPKGFWKKITGEGFERCFYFKNEPVENKKSDTLREHEVNCSSLE
jgi:endonuclease G